MGASGFQLQSVAELEARVRAERGTQPFLLFRDGDGRLHVVTLDEHESPLPIGRRPDRGIRLDWDPMVSRVHAVLELVGGAWTVADDGLSRNGSYVNDQRVVGRQRLGDGDSLRFGDVVVQFRDPSGSLSDETVLPPEHAGTSGGPSVSPAQRRVLVALCRPLRDSEHQPPATNKQIAAELQLSVEAVKTHLRNLFDVLGVDDLPQNQKRSQLAWRALTIGVIKPRDLL